MSLPQKPAALIGLRPPSEARTISPPGICAAQDSTRSPAPDGGKSAGRRGRQSVGLHVEKRRLTLIQRSARILVGGGAVAGRPLASGCCLRRLGVFVAEPPQKPAALIGLRPPSEARTISPPGIYAAQNSTRSPAPDGGKSAGRRGRQSVGLHVEKRRLTLIQRSARIMVGGGAVAGRPDLWGFGLGVREQGLIEQPASYPSPEDGRHRLFRGSGGG